MTTLSPKFLVFNSKKGPRDEDAGLVYCSAKGTKIEWPKSARRGGPRKGQDQYGTPSKHPSKEIEKPSNQYYEFVDCSKGRQPSDSNARKFVRTHVMRNYQGRKDRVPDTAVEDQGKDTRVVTGCGQPFTLSTRRWSRDPFDSFPIKMQPHMHELLYLYVSAAADHLYPIEAHWGLNPTRKHWVPLALTDPILLSSVLFSSQQFEARVAGQKERPSAINHLGQAVQGLNKRLQDPRQKLSDTTIAAVAGLALTEQSIGNQANWRVHMLGIKRMVEMRGGLLAFESNPILYDKLRRADICGSIYDLSRPYLNVGSTRPQSNILRDYDEVEMHLSPGFKAIHNDHGLNPDLLDILCQLNTISRDLKAVNPPKSDTAPLELRRRIRFIQYFLLNKDYFDASEPAAQIYRTCCLGALLYLATIQNELGLSPISKRLTLVLKTPLQSESHSVLRLQLWLLFLAGCIVTDPVDKSWFLFSIGEAALQLSLTNWLDTKMLLETFAWNGKVQDRAGRDLWDEAMGLRRVLGE